MSRVSPPDRLSAALKGHKISKKGKASKNKRSFSEDDTRYDTQLNKRSIESDLGKPLVTLVTLCLAHQGLKL